MTGFSIDINIMCFLSSCALVAYTTVVYPVIVWSLARIRKSRIQQISAAPKAISFILTGHKEGQRISDKVQEIICQIDEAKVLGQIIVVLDGINGGPNTLLESLTETTTDDRVRFSSLPSNHGKAAALSEGACLAKHDVLVFADTRQSWNHDALAFILKGFCDPTVGAVSGDLVLRKPSDNSETDGVGFYWRYEKWLRKQESKLDSVVGVTGAICAVRRELFSGLPSGTILDDVYWPLVVIMQGFRVKHIPQAIAFDQLPEHASDELLRKVRTLAGNYQLLTLLPTALLPWKNRVWWQYLSHKVLRLLVPWALIVALLCCYFIDTTIYQFLFGLQIFFYSAILIGMLTGVAYRFRISSALASFLMLNYAAWLAFWVWLLGREGRIWVKIDYDKKDK